MVGMHIHIIPNRNSTPAVLLRESYRVGGNVRKRTLANLSKLPMDAVDAIRRILKGEKLVSVEVAFKIVENGSLHHGHVGDRGMITQTQIDELREMDGCRLDYRSASRTDSQAHQRWGAPDGAIRRAESV